MKNHHSPMRRKFLKAGVGMSVLAVFPLKKRLQSSVFLPIQTHELSGCDPDSLQERIHEISLKYGGEFAGVKPERRRNDHGCV